MAAAPSRRRAPFVAVLLIVAAAAWWRFALLGSPGLWLDEILGVRGVGPEHGPIYYALMRLTTRAEPDEVLTRLPFALAGLAAVVVAFLAGRAASGPWLGIGVAAATAASPIHVYYSREARPYALLLLCGVTGLYALARALDGHRPLSAVPLLAAAAIGAVLCSANGVAVAAALLAAALWTWPATRREAVAWMTALAGIGAACWWLSQRIYPAPTGTRDVLPGAAEVMAAAAPLVGALFSGHREMSPVPNAAWIGLGLAAAGAVAIGRRSPRLALALVTAAVVGLALPVGLMLWLQHGISVRYALAAFPALTLLAAGPLAILDQQEPAWAHDGRAPAAGAAVLLAMLALGHADAMRAASREKADWRRVAAIVAERTAPGDTVIVSNDWSEVCLTYYLPAGASARRVVNANESLPDAKRLAADAGHALLVAAGAYAWSRDVPRWMEDLPRVWRGPREDLLIAFYPDRATYLRTAIAPVEVAADERRLATMLHGRIDMTVNARDYLLTGWHGAEVYRRDTPFRWADPSATAYLPVAARWPTALATKVRPHPRLVDRRIVVLINGVAVGEALLTDEWTDVRVPIPRQALKAGANTIELRTAAPPAPYDRGAKAVQAIELR